MAKGYSASADILTRTRDGQDLNAIWQQYQQALADFNATRQPLIDILSFTTTQIIEDVVAPGQETFERATEFGIPVSIRPAPAPTARAYPFDWYDTRNGYTFQFLAGGPNQTSGASQAQLDNVLNQVMEADNQLQFSLVMKALFNDANRTTIIDGASYTVTALYNADGMYIPPYKGQTFVPGSHTHYTFSGQASQTAFDAQDHLDLARLVEEHGYTRANGFNVVFLMNPTDAANGIMRFVRNVALDLGAAVDPVSLYDFIPSAGQNLALQLPPGFTLVGGLPPNTFAGMDVAGSWGPYLVITDAQIPAGYMVAVATAGQSVNSNVIGIREHANPSFNGLVLVPGNRTNNYPLIDSYFIRGLGSAVGPRGAAAVMRLHATTYAVPAAFVW
jgi:hypothetical protein